MHHGNCGVPGVAVLVGLLVVAPGADEANELYRRGKDCFEKRDFPGAVRVFEQMIAIAPEEKRGYRCRGIGFLLSGNPKAAISDFSVAMGIDRRDPVLYYGRACAYRLLGNERAALADLHEAIRLNPRYVAARTCRAMVAADRGELVRPLVDALLSVWAIRQDLEKLEAGKADWRAYTDLAEGTQVALDDLLVYKCWAMLYEEYRASTKPAADPSVTSADKRHDAHAHKHLAVVYATQGNRQMAMASLNSAIGLAPKDASLYRLRAAIHVTGADLKAALGDVTKAIDLNPTDPENYEYRAQIYTEMGDFPRACLDRAQVLRLLQQRTEEMRKSIHVRQEGSGDRTP